MVGGTREHARQRANAAHDGIPGRQDVRGDPRSESRGLREDEYPRAAHGQSHAARRPRAVCRWGEGAGPRAVRDAVAHDSDRRPDSGSRAIGARPESQSAERHRQHRLDQADEVRRDLVGHAHQHDDVELGPQARRDDHEYQALHRFRRGERIRRRPGGGLERRLGRRLDPEPQRVLIHPAVSRLRSRRARPLRAREGREADRAQRDVRRNREL